MGKVVLKEKVQIVGFYDPVGLDLEDSTTLQVVYLIGDKHYVLFTEDNDVLAKIILEIDMISDMHDDKDKMYYDVSEFMSHFQASVLGDKQFKLYEIDINDIHNLIPFDASKTLMSDNFKVSNREWNGAVMLGDGRIAVGDEEFLEKAVTDNVTDKKRKYQLLENIYYDFCDFEKREKVINDFFYEFYDNESKVEKEIWDNKKRNNYLVLYAFSLLGPLNVNFQEIGDIKTIQDKKTL